MSITLILLVAALVMTLWHAANGKPPLWIAVLLVVLALLIGSFPLR